MRYLFWLWLVPLSLFWGWFGLSYYDVNFGLTMFSRELHDLVFRIYGTLLHIDPATIPWLFFKACIFDTVLIFGIVAYRKRRAIRNWWTSRKAGQEPETGEAPDEAATVQLPAE